MAPPLSLLEEPFGQMTVELKGRKRGEEGDGKVVFLDFGLSRPRKFVMWLWKVWTVPTIFVAL